MLDTPIKKRGPGAEPPEKFSISTDPPPSKLPKNSEGGDLYGYLQMGDFYI